ncbi:hypothetical protein FocTR4_00017132 [Fusarium oxysporum f. sp. cubense]|uniref:Uncharacterized protein n=1 Tax=Fusarium oxysporum f. sp. cubense TaxID=61366 RepID=A0A5C6SKB7_FUSOC|nr:hypothetical protein FocTR4_00017132 [Fusarium oxysporum f. sp. cubense]
MRRSVSVELPDLPAGKMLSTSRSLVGETLMLSLLSRSSSARLPTEPRMRSLLRLATHMI